MKLNYSIGKNYGRWQFLINKFHLYSKSDNGGKN